MNLLTIAGSDPSGGAGIQKDILTFSRFGFNGFSVITNITSQNSKHFLSVDSVSVKTIQNQLNSILEDFEINGIKLGMLYNNDCINAITPIIKKLKIPIVTDPVIKSTSGGILLEKNALNNFIKKIIPLSTALTPNVKEAEIISGIKIKSKKDLLLSAKQLFKLGTQNVIITGFNEDAKITDLFFSQGERKFFTSKKIYNENHGSGCGFSAALLVAISKGKAMTEAVKFARQFAIASIKDAKKLGKGYPIAMVKKSQVEETLQEAIFELKQIKNCYKLIPECQTNFVYAKSNPKSTNDIIGVKGRIVKTGKEITVAGNLEKGGSKHVAKAVLEVNKKYSQIRSAINIRFDKKFLQKCYQEKLNVLSYSRAKEPNHIKNQDNRTIKWGINKALKNSKKAPDIIYHKGDYGKEPMILVFGEDPFKVLEKIKIII